MKADIAFGQYFEGKSFIHKLCPKWKILFAIFFIVILFLAKNVWSFALITAAALCLVLLSRVGPGVLLRGLRPLILIIVFTSLINVFWYQGKTPLFEYGIIHIYVEGVTNAALIVLRVILLVATTSIILTYTTTPIALTDGIEQLLYPLSKIKIPVHEFSMMMTIALRFIPTLIEETDKIMCAQKARGADFSSGSLAKRARALVPILVPLFVSAFRRASELACAMECRCYTGGEGRTRMNVLKSSWRDLVMLLLLCALCAGVVLIDKFVPGYVLTL